MTNAVLSRMIGRRLLRISRSEVVRHSQYSSAGQKKQQHRLGWQVDLPQRGHEPKQHPTHQQEHWRGDPQPAADDAAYQHRHPEDHDEL
jgi:hypothetical protein